MRRPPGAAGIAAALLASGSAALASDRPVVPGLMGYNALPTIPNADPVVGGRVAVELALAAQASDLGRARDASLTPYFKLTVPIAGLVALEFDGTPVEWWRTSPRTQALQGAAAGSGTAHGDIRFGARFQLLREGPSWPAIGGRFVTKTTTGKELNQKRFTNAPAYVLDALFAKDLLGPNGSLQRVRLLARVGFMTWQQGNDHQDDAPTYGATVELTSRGGFQTALEFRGYWGYQTRDKPHVLGLGVTLPGDWIDGVATLNRGLSPDAPPWEARLGVVFHIDSPWARGAVSEPSNPDSG